MIDPLTAEQNLGVRSFIAERDVVIRARTLREVGEQLHAQGIVLYRRDGEKVELADLIQHEERTSV